MKKLFIGMGVVAMTVTLFVIFASGQKDISISVLARELMAQIGLVAQEEITIEIVDMAFVPLTITVRPGTKVTWVNRDAMRHNIAADDGSFKTELFGRGESVSITFRKIGTFSYYCSPHPFMKGTVTVVE